MLKKLCVILLFIFSFVPVSAYSWSVPGAESTQECVSKTLQEVKIKSATGYIRSTCRCKFSDGCSSYEKKFSDCFLKNIVTAQSEGATGLVERACRCEASDACAGFEKSSSECFLKNMHDATTQGALSSVWNACKAR